MAVSSAQRPPTSSPKQRGDSVGLVEFGVPLPAFGPCCVAHGPTRVVVCSILRASGHRADEVSVNGKLAAGHCRRPRCAAHYR